MTEEELTYYEYGKSARLNHNNQLLYDAFINGYRDMHREILDEKQDRFREPDSKGYPWQK